MSFDNIQMILNFFTFFMTKLFFLKAKQKWLNVYTKSFNIIVSFLTLVKIKKFIEYIGKK